MATAIVASTRPVTREKLALFLPTHELIKAFENLISDVSVTIPDFSESIIEETREAQETADSAIAEAAAARAIAEMVKKLVLAIVSGPPPAPAARQETADELITQIATLQSLVARLTQRVENLEEGPMP